MTRSAKPRTAERISEIIANLYAGTLDDAAWGRAMIQIADNARASSALLFAYNPQTGAVLRDENHRFDPVAVDLYRRHWSYQDCRLKPMLSVPILEPLPEQAMGIPDWHRTAFLNDFLFPIDAPHALPAWLFKSPTKAVTLSLQGTRERGPFERQDLENYRKILPHLRRALDIRDRLEQSQVRADALAASLNELSFAVLMLDESGKVLESNAVAQQFYRANREVGLAVDGKLRLTEPANSQFYKCITSPLSAPSEADGVIRIQRPGASPLSLLVAPVPPHTTQWMSSDLRWVVLIFDPDRSMRASAKVIARDLSVSAREAALAVLLFAGSDLKTAARRLGISAHTARFQLKSIFNKTGQHTQADLVRRIALGPAIWRHAVSRDVPTNRGST